MLEMKIEKLEEFGIEALRAKLEVSGREIKDGDKIIIVDKQEDVVESGAVKFCVYDDEESPFYHLGFIVRWSDGHSITLAEVFRWIKEDGLKWEVMRNG